ncbi:MAG: hypothetical protein H6813_00810 [Phycisphaeraceae bacterium]|nr:hypothetical protein [Phycisphaeraceae bacterium]MCB9847374.1 hypothetical protein [Phycisphaeraceae bacterium]
MTISRARRRISLAYIALAVLSALAAVVAPGCGSVPGPAQVNAPTMHSVHTPLRVMVEAEGLDGVGSLSTGQLQVINSGKSALIGLLGEVPHFAYIAERDPKYPVYDSLVVKMEYLETQTEGQPIRRLNFEPGAAQVEHNPKLPDNMPGLDANVAFVGCRVTLLLDRNEPGLPRKSIAIGRGEARWSATKKYVLWGKRNAGSPTHAIYWTIEKAVANALEDMLSGRRLAQVEGHIRALELARDAERRRKLAGIEPDGADSR